MTAAATSVLPGSTLRSNTRARWPPRRPRRHGNRFCIAQLAIAGEEQKGSAKISATCRKLLACCMRNLSLAGEFAHCLNAYPRSFRRPRAFWM